MTQQGEPDMAPRGGYGDLNAQPKHAPRGGIPPGFDNQVGRIQIPW